MPSTNMMPLTLPNSEVDTESQVGSLEEPQPQPETPEDQEDARGSGCNISPSSSEESEGPRNRIPTHEDLLVSLRRVTQAVEEHQQLLLRAAAAQPQGGRR
ncbi:uncharacterized protein [Dendrobates tinctorius]|uniref:uncharacterized protein isoform X2 n=1 Tax=Dendrobates tinctorius TaxID=92724 RepID=UPI003CC970A3